MFRNQYDTDVTTWSPAGSAISGGVRNGGREARFGGDRFEIEGFACVNKVNSKLYSHQKKIFKVDDHIGVAIAGLTADGRELSQYMRSESINHSYSYESPFPVGRPVVQLANKAQATRKARPGRLRIQSG